MVIFMTSLIFSTTLFSNQVINKVLKHKIHPMIIVLQRLTGFGILSAKRWHNCFTETIEDISYCFRK